MQIKSYFLENKFFTIPILAFLLTAMLASWAYADEETLIKIDGVSNIERVSILGNGEIWMYGYNSDKRAYWAAQVNPDGTIANMLPDMDVVPYDFALQGDTRYMLGRYDGAYKTGGIMKGRSVLVPIEEDGDIGEFSEVYGLGMIDLPSGMLLIAGDPWLAFYDANLNVIFAVDRPVGIVSTLDENHGILSIYSAEEVPDGIVLFGQLEMGLCYFMKLSFDGTIVNYHEVVTGLNATDMKILNDQIMFIGKEHQNSKPGATYLVCMDFNGEMQWKKRITDSDGSITLHRMFNTTEGFVFYGWKDVLYERGNRLYPCLITATHDGRVGKEVVITYMDIPGASGVLLEDRFYIFGTKREYIDEIPGDSGFMDVFDIAPSWFGN